MSKANKFKSVLSAILLTQATLLWSSMASCAPHLNTMIESFSGKGLTVAIKLKEPRPLGSEFVFHLPRDRNSWERTRNGASRTARSRIDFWLEDGEFPPMELDEVRVFFSQYSSVVCVPEANSSRSLEVPSTRNSNRYPPFQLDVTVTGNDQCYWRITRGQTGDGASDGKGPGAAGSAFQEAPGPFRSVEEAPARTGSAYRFDFPSLEAGTRLRINYRSSGSAQEKNEDLALGPEREFPLVVQDGHIVQMEICERDVGFFVRHLVTPSLVVNGEGRRPDGATVTPTPSCWQVANLKKGENSLRFLMSQRTIFGQVIDSNNKPLAGAEVWIDKKNTACHEIYPKSVITNNQGRFTLVSGDSRKDASMVDSCSPAASLDNYSLSGIEPTNSGDWLISMTPRTWRLSFSVQGFEGAGTPITCLYSSSLTSRWEDVRSQDSTGGLFHFEFPVLAEEFKCLLAQDARPRFDVMEEKWEKKSFKILGSRYRTDEFLHENKKRLGKPISVTLTPKCSPVIAEVDILLGTNGLPGASALPLPGGNLRFKRAGQQPDEVPVDSLGTHGESPQRVNVTACHDSLDLVVNGKGFYPPGTYRCTGPEKGDTWRYTCDMQSAVARPEVVFLVRRSGADDGVAKACLEIAGMFRDPDRGLGKLNASVSVMYAYGSHFKWEVRRSTTPGTVASALETVARHPVDRNQSINPGDDFQRVRDVASETGGQTIVLYLLPSDPTLSDIRINWNRQSHGSITRVGLIEMTDPNTPEGARENASKLLHNFGDRGRYRPLRPEDVPTAVRDFVIERLDWR